MVPLPRRAGSNRHPFSQSSLGTFSGDDELLQTRETPVERYSRRLRRLRKITLCRSLVFLAISTLVMCGFLVLGELRYFLSRIPDTPILSNQTLSPACPIHSLNQSEWLLHSINSSQYDRHTSLPEHRPLRMLSSQTEMSQACADLWISRGEVCQEIQAGGGLGEVSIDAVWSSMEDTPHFRAWKAAYAAAATAATDEAAAVDHHFRSHDEMRYSLRSAWRNLPFARRLFLLSSALPITPPSADIAATPSYITAAPCVAAQIPGWLNTSTAKLSSGPERESRLEVIPHYELFHTHAKDISELEEWKNQAIPTFNSHAIESQLANLPNVAEHILYFNNDFYAGRPFSPADVATSLFGQVYRIYRNAWIEGAESVEKAMLIDGQGNARVMPATVRLLDERFGRRRRNYPTHVMYGMATPLLEEATSLWAEEMKETATVRFRGRGPEYWLPFLAMYYNIEKHREAMLWSFLIARSDVDGSDTLSTAERADMLAAIGGHREGDEIKIRRPYRSTSVGKVLRLLDQAKIAKPLHTTYVWTSLDGYMHFLGDGGAEALPDYGKDDSASSATFCSIDIPKCFGSAEFFDSQASYDELQRSSTDIFKHLAFGEPTCGDCLIAALLRQSGPAGFEAFLPPPSPGRLKGSPPDAVPHIGSWEKRWQEADFSRSQNLLFDRGNRWGAREFAIRLIQRYSYATGDSPVSFFELTDDIESLEWRFYRSEEEKPAFIAINDHLSGTNATIAAQADEMFRGFQARMWPDPSPFEKVP